MSRPSWLRWEVVAVLGVSLGMSGLYALFYLIRAEVTVSGGISATTATVISGAQSTYHWLDLVDGLADVLHGLFPAILALVLLYANPGIRDIGFDGKNLGKEIGYGIGFTALIGLPGLGLVWLAHEWGLNASLDVVSMPNIWYRVPLLLLDAAQNGILEEIVVVGYLLTRLRQLRWSQPTAIIAAAVLRGSYHLYQGFGGFAGNFVMGIIFGYWFWRTRRVLPLLVAHTLLDAFSFIGYIYLSPHISWI